MICPKCGSRDVLDTRKDKIIYAECQRCLYEWEMLYNPFPKPKEEIRRQE